MNQDERETLKSRIAEIRAGLSKFQTKLSSDEKPIVNDPSERIEDKKLNEHIPGWLDKYIKQQLSKQQWLSKGLFILLVAEIFIAFAIVCFVGWKWLVLDQWLVALIFNVIILQTFGLVFVVVKNIFPNKGTILEHLKSIHNGKND